LAVREPERLPPLFVFVFFLLLGPLPVGGRERLPLFFVVVFFCVEDAMLLSFEVPISFVYRQCSATEMRRKIFGFPEALS